MELYCPAPGVASAARGCHANLPWKGKASRGAFPIVALGDVGSLDIHVCRPAVHCEAEDTDFCGGVGEGDLWCVASEALRCNTRRCTGGGIGRGAAAASVDHKDGAAAAMAAASAAAAAEAAATTAALMPPA
mmetsp:Transcript_54419/g.158111  ORF Transcript_54419/g.158111 Transcript_54419/m.158111 type:complete len:132 (-) Transcript_54419:796-1191(-)